MIEGIKDKREIEKSPLRRLHFEVRPDAAGRVTSFNTPAQREGKNRDIRKCRKEKEKREKRILISSLLPRIKGRERQQKAVCCALLGGSLPV